MAKEIFNTPKLARSYWPASAHATRAGDFVFVTGQVANQPGSDPRDRKETELGTLEAQTIRVMENVKAILEEAGTSLENVVKRNVPDSSGRLPTCIQHPRALLQVTRSKHRSGYRTSASKRAGRS